MKKTIAILLLVSGTLAFAQQSPSSVPSKDIFNYHLESPNKPKYSLKMTPFKLEDFIQNTNTLSEFLRKSNSEREKPANNMPIFVPGGKFFLEIYKVDDDIDHKLKIFDLEKSKYNSRKLG